MSLIDFIISFYYIVRLTVIKLTSIEGLSREAHIQIGTNINSTRDGLLREDNDVWLNPVMVN